MACAVCTKRPASKNIESRQKAQELSEVAFNLEIANSEQTQHSLACGKWPYDVATRISKIIRHDHIYIMYKHLIKEAIKSCCL